MEENSGELFAGRPPAIGCLRLSTEPDRDDARSIAVLHAAFDAGVTWLDTADAYCWNESERGHNERLIVRAVATWNGDRRIRVATKGGLTRPEGRWEPDGRAKRLIAACEGSRRALGGRRSRSRTAADPVLNRIAADHQATPFEIALAWLLDLAPVIVPLPGVTRVETARSTSRAHQIELTEDDRRALDERFPSGRLLRSGMPPRRPAAAHRQDTDVVLVMGLPGAGKTTFAETLVGRGYTRLNRDDAGGRLRDVLPALDAALASGATRIVVDNTYVSRKSRAAIVQAASRRGVPVRCTWLATSVEDAQANAAWRLVSRYGRLPGGDELAALQKHDVAAFQPTVPFRYQRDLEPPQIAEGFSRVDVVPFARQHPPDYVHRALIVWCDDILVRRRSAGEESSEPVHMLVATDRAAILRRYHEEGWRVLGMSWQPELDAGTRSAADVAEMCSRVNERLGFAMEIEYCPHAAGPPRCWCRKPLPGLGVVFIHRYKLDPAQCLYVGAGAQDPGFARKLGFTYRHASDFFGPATCWA